MPSQKSKGRKKQRDHAKAQPTAPPVTFPASMSQAEMQHIIANAIIEAQKEKEDAKKKQKETNIRELQEAIGLKEYNDKNRLLRIIKIAINRIKCLFKICFLSRKNIKGDRVTFGILSMLLTLIFALVSLVLHVVTFIFFVCGIIALIRGQGAPLWGRYYSSSRMERGKSLAEVTPNLHQLAVEQQRNIMGYTPTKF